MKNSIFQQCLDILNREDIKYDLKMLSTSLINLLLTEINPYIYIILGFCLLIFVMILAILILLIYMLRIKKDI
jgi:hypothetical protein